MKILSVLFAVIIFVSCQSFKNDKSITEEQIYIEYFTVSQITDHVKLFDGKLIQIDSIYYEIGNTSSVVHKFFNYNNDGNLLTFSLKSDTSNYNAEVKFDYENKKTTWYIPGKDKKEIDFFRFGNHGIAFFDTGYTIDKNPDKIIFTIRYCFNQDTKRLTALIIPFGLNSTSKIVDGVDLYTAKNMDGKMNIQKDEQKSRYIFSVFENESYIEKYVIEIPIKEISPFFSIQLYE